MAESVISALTSWKSENAKAIAQNTPRKKIATPGGSAERRGKKPPHARPKSRIPKPDEGRTERPNPRSIIGATIRRKALLVSRTRLGTANPPTQLGQPQDAELYASAVINEGGVAHIAPRLGNEHTTSNRMIASCHPAEVNRKCIKATNPRRSYN